MPKRVSGKWYAQAMFELAREKGVLEDCRKGLQKIAELSKDEMLVALLENPKLPFEAKEHLVKERLGEVHFFVYHLALLLVHKGAIRLGRDILNQYRLLFDAHQGIEHAEVTTAIPLDERDKEMVSKRIGEVLGRKVTLDLHVEPSLLGGFIAQVGDMVFDGSIRRNLENLEKSLVEAGRP